MRFIPLRNGNYGFVPSKNNNSNISKRKLLSDLPKTFAVTGDYNNIARNHCAATALTNLMLIFDKRIDRDQVFESIHRFVKNGPVFDLEKHARLYFKSEDLPISCTTYKRSFNSDSLEQLKKIAAGEIDRGVPCALLLASDLFNWHWVVCVGYIRQDSDTLLIIADNWHSRELFAYDPDKTSMLRKVVTFTKAAAGQDSRLSY